MLQFSLVQWFGLGAVALGLVLWVATTDAAKALFGRLKDAVLPPKIDFEVTTLPTSEPAPLDPPRAYYELFEQLDAVGRAYLEKDVWPAVHRAMFGQAEPPPSERIAEPPS